MNTCYAQIYTQKKEWMYKHQNGNKWLSMDSVSGQFFSVYFVF